MLVTLTALRPPPAGVRQREPGRPVGLLLGDSARQGDLGLVPSIRPEGRRKLQGDFPSHPTEVVARGGWETLLCCLFSVTCFSCFSCFCPCASFLLDPDLNSCVKNGLGEYFNVETACSEKNKALRQGTGTICRKAEQRRETQRQSLHSL